mgnify:CR=1 FL=1
MEEDFFVRTKDELVPVEVKANKNRSKSLRKLIDNESYSDIKWGIKLADSNVGNRKWHLYISIFLLLFD